MAHRGGGRRPRRHTKAFTYEPKIPAVRSGDCDQTIRPMPKSEDPDEAVHVGDEILFHGWEDKPYHSPWSWRIEVEVTEVLHIHAGNIGITSRAPGTLNTTLKMWDSAWCRKLAERDHLSPPTGKELRRVLMSRMKKGEVMKAFQVIRWATQGRDTEMYGDKKKTTRKRKDKPVKKQPAKKQPAKKVPAGKKSTEKEVLDRHGPKKPHAKVPAKAPARVFQDMRHRPRSEPVERHLYYTKFEAGDVSATINHTDIVDLIAGIKKMAAESARTPAEKRTEYNRRVKALVASKLKFADGSIFDQGSHKHATSIANLVKERVPFREPNRHLDDFVHD